MNSNKQDSLVWGFIILGLGMLFLLKNMGIDLDIWNFIGKFWPSILILIGVKNIFFYLKSKT